MIFGSKPRNVISCEGRDVPYELVRRRRVTRNVYLELSEEGGLRIVAPVRMSERAVHRAVQEKSSHVLEFLARAHEKRRARPRLEYLDGEEHLYLGDPYPLLLQPLKRGMPRDVFDGKRILLAVRNSEPDTVRDALRRWYRDRATSHFQQRLQHFSHIAKWTGGQVPPLQIRRMKRTMGNCSQSGLIKMNPHMIKAPPFLIDYVIAHEVCHLKEHNHGPGFYHLQEVLFPEWRTAKMQLERDWTRFQAE